MPARGELVAQLAAAVEQQRHRDDRTPHLLDRRNASNNALPVVAVSSTMSTRWPGSSTPAIRPPTPWSFASLRIANARLAGHEGDGECDRHRADHRAADGVVVASAVMPASASASTIASPTICEAVAPEAHLPAVEIPVRRPAGVERELAFADRVLPQHGGERDLGRAQRHAAPTTVAGASSDRSMTRPSVEPRSASEARSGCGMSPTTFRPSLQIPAMSSSAPFGFST